ncbi:hypothetical protein N7492_004362 [Penicillium capsulatum]|uniref:Uncharacterized protein n=1 Tax=Penicillium capsulatum TaxID=69766 RepID=A0A9W9I9Q9_9EURO|nr:hypothetical protein N7492_004362 [Penicillium capsulatum]KAJ6136519.1 hypothetical protein N7512_001679 [Penicillium capsulatum]
MFHSALLVQRSGTDDGAYKIGQVETPALGDYRTKNRMTFSSTPGIFGVSGSIHTSTLEMEVALEVYQMNLGTFHGYANQPFKIELDLSMVKGSIDLRVNGLDELWLDIDARVFQVAENGPGRFIEYKKAYIVQEMPGIRCAPWLSPGSDV